MKTMVINGVTFILTEQTAAQVQAEFDRIRAERHNQWMLFHWYARRWVMYGDVGAYDMFSDLYKGETGMRPRFSKEDVFRFLNIQAKIACKW